ncbi:MAG: hypothetical protein WBB25_12230, partial [Sulfitobacter sp.]
MTTLPDPLRSRLGRFVHSWRGFRGHVDGFLDGAITGWAAPGDPKSGALRIGLFTSQGMIAEVTANMFRGDLQAAGIGTGYHGFVIPLDAVQRRSVASAGGDVTVQILGRSGGRLGKLHLTDLGRYEKVTEKVVEKTMDAPVEHKTQKGKTGALRAFLHGDLEHINAFANAAKRPPRPDARSPLGVHTGLFDTGDRLKGGTLPAP